MQGHLGIPGEPSGDKIYENTEEGITLIYDQHTQIITFWEDGVKYDHLDCAYFNDWCSVTIELATEYGIKL